MKNAIRQFSHIAILTFSVLALPWSAWAGDAAASAAAPAVQTPPAVEAAAPIVLLPKESAPRIRLGYIDANKVVEESKAGKAGKALFRDKADKFEAKAKAKEKQLDKLKAALEAQLPTLTPDQRQAKIKEFDKKVEEFRHFAQNVEKEMRALQDELNKSIFVSLEKAARTYGSANGYSIIVTKRELLYLGSNVDVQDLTDAILKQVNEPQ
jgi:outer membrane protein